MSAGSAIPGWYQDPYSAEWFVWWDGEEWHPDMRRRAQADDPTLKSRTVAGVLGIVLGGLGVHSFYLGKTGTGIAQIIVTIFTLGLGHLWGMIEGILILTHSPNFQTDGHGRPLRD